MTTETISGEISAAPHNTNVGNLKTALQSHTHGLDNKVGWDSMKSDFRPPDTGDSTNRWRVVSGTKTVALTSGSGTATITFATDADQGDPAFTSAPVVLFGCENLLPVYGYTSSVTTTTCALRAHQIDATTITGNVDMYWIAMGQVTA